MVLFIFYLALNVSTTNIWVKQKQTLTARVAGHRSDINTRSVRKCPHVVTHFNAPGHSLQDMRIFPIEQMRSSDSNSRKMREKFWMSKLRTVYPHGLNELS